MKIRTGGERSCPERRGQSSVIGVVLILGLVITSMTVIATVGGVALLNTEDELSVSRAEKVMTQFDSQSALVALGETNARQTQLASGNAGEYTLDEDAGWMRISIRNTTANTTQEITNTSLGSLTYETDGTRLAYQGGGVWKKGDGDAVMVSPPEFHYRDRTLTLPVINVTGDDQVSGQVTVRQGGISQEYPNETFVNPVPKEREVVVTVKSEYYRGWGSYFERRTDGNVSYDDANRTASITLTVPIIENFDETITATGTVTIGGNAGNGNSGNGNSGSIEFTEGATRPSASDRIETQIQNCESGGCTNLSSPVSNDLTSGVYYSNSSITLDSSVTMNTSGGDIDIVVDGGLSYSGNDNLEITGDSNVTFYLKDGIEFTGNGEMNTDGKASSLITYIHSDADQIIKGTGTPSYRGLIYAPNTDMKLGGNAAFNGSAVVRNADIQGNPTVSSNENIDITVEFAGDAGITYLHISKNEVEIADS